MKANNPSNEAKEALSRVLTVIASTKLHRESIGRLSSRPFAASSKRSDAFKTKSGHRQLAIGLRPCHSNFEIYAGRSRRHSTEAQAKRQRRSKSSSRLLSRCLRNLEYRLGGTFSSAPMPARSTIEGQELLDSPQRIMDQTEAIAPRLKTRWRGESG